MCEYYDIDGVTIDTIAELRNVFGARVIAWEGNYYTALTKSDEALDECLCGVDMIRTAANAGYDVDRDPVTPERLILTRIHKAEDPGAPVESAIKRMRQAALAALKAVKS